MKFFFLAVTTTMRESAGAAGANSGLGKRGSQCAPVVTLLLWQLTIVGGCSARGWLGDSAESGSSRTSESGGPTPSFETSSASDTETVSNPPENVVEANASSARGGSEQFSKCQELANRAHRIANDAARVAAQCSSDADCHTYDTADLEVCWMSCDPLWLGGAAHEAAVRDAISGPLVQESCREFRAMGCQMLPPSCPAPPEGELSGFSCVESRCVAAFD